MVKGGWLEKATDYTGKVAEQMDSLLEKKYEKHLSDVAEAKQNAKKIGRNVTEPVPIPTMDVSKTTDVPIPTMDVSKTTDVPIPTMDTTDEKQAAVDYGGLEQPSLTLQNTASDIFVTNVGKTEGTTWHSDLKKIKTSPYGINTVLHKNLLDNLQAKANVNKWKDIPLSMLKEAAKKLFEDEYLKPYVDGKVSGTTASTFNSLSEEAKFLVGSATYNGGKYPNLVNNLSAWEKNPTMNTLEAVISETPRTVTLNGVRTRVKGLDNRAVRDLEIAGIIDKNNPRHRTALRKWLPLTTEVEFPTPPVPGFKPTKPLSLHPI
jgi:hypothetical protein